MSPKRCVIYARISVATEESVSIEGQIEAARHYAAARGWQVVGEPFTDVGVSATYYRPEVRPGWRALLDSDERFDAVIILKADRLARRVLDFLHAADALQGRGAGIVAVKEQIDMTTAQGRAFATLLAVFGEMEAETIRDRVKDARRKLIKLGRVVGGTVPYGWRSIPNPDGAGLVLVQDPDRVEYVRQAAQMVLEGGTVYSVVQWLNSARAPLPSASQKNRKTTGWIYSTVERLLRNPVLAGMTSSNPGNQSKVRGTEVLRGADGLPVVDESVGIMSPEEWRALVRKLDERTSAQSKPRAPQAKTSGLLSGLMWCGEHLDEAGNGTRMHRGITMERHGYYCPVCHQTITNFETILVDEFLRLKGDHVRWSVVEEVYEGGLALLPDIEHRLTELSGQLQATDDDEIADALSTQIATLRKMRRDARAEAPRVVLRPVRETQYFGQDWTAAESPAEQRAVLDDAVNRVWVIRGALGRRTVASVLARLVFDWKSPEHLGPIETPTDEELLASTTFDRA